MTNKLVKDYLGNLILKSKAYKIMGKYYEDNVSCFLMEDGQRYRVTSTEKIIFDYYKKKYVLKASSNLIKGIINANKEEGQFSENDFMVQIADANGKRSTLYCLNTEIAEALGYQECLSDGLFYKFDKENPEKMTFLSKKAIPQHERSKSYNLESDQKRKKELEEYYSNLNIKTSASSVEIAKLIGDFTFGMEIEVINGFLPRRIRSLLGIKALKDGSLRHSDGEGIEYVSVPMSGAKGIEVIKRFCQEASKRCEVNNLCSVHFHFGKVRMDKLYVLSLYRILQMIQDELMRYFPYSRVNSIKEDGKVYCKPLVDLKFDCNTILKAKDEEDFHKRTIFEFNKLYTWLNNGKPLAEEYGERTIVRETFVKDGKKMFCDKWIKNIYTTKSVYHAITGNKWDREQRYYLVNFLNLFFSKIHTVEFRLHEGSTNTTKVLSWMLICSSILKYAEDIKRGLSLKILTLKEILEDQLPNKYSEYLMEYLKFRHNTFFNENGEYKSYKTIEKLWFGKDNEFKFVNNNFEIK